jgi:hypothetical protein
MNKEEHLEIHRSGWTEGFCEMAQSGDDKLIDEGAATTWDEEEWEW